MKACHFTKASAAAVCSLPTEAGTAGQSSHPSRPDTARSQQSNTCPNPAQPEASQRQLGPGTRRPFVSSASAVRTVSFVQNPVQPRVGGAVCLAAHVLPPQTLTCHSERARKCKQREARNVFWPSPVKNPSYVSACLGGLCLSF